jgi:hypothetical protein
MMSKILADTRAFVTTKQASFGKQAIAGQDPSTMPGSEHDSKTPTEAQKPNPETRDGTMVPNSGLSTEGAKDDSPKTRGHALEADQAAETPEKKPAITSDANAKTAEGPAALANDILGLIRGAQKVASTPAPVQVKTPEVKVAEAPKAPVQVKTPVAEKKAGELDMVLTTDVMAKIAALVLSTEEGAAVVESVLSKQAGAEAAQETLAFLAEQSALAEKVASFEAGQADAQALIEQRIFEAGRAAGLSQKQAEAFYQKLGQVAADASMPPEAAGAEQVPGADAAAAGMADPGAGAEAGGEAGGEQGPVTMEDIVGALEALVQEGAIEPEVAQEVMQQIAGAGGEAGGEAAPGGEAGGEAAPAGAEAAPGGEAGAEPVPEKAASVLLKAIQALKK